MKARLKKSGAVLIEVLKEELDCKNERQLASKLGVLSPQIAAWRNNDITHRTAKNIIKKLDTRFVRNAFQPICEFQKLSAIREGLPNTIRNRISSKELRESLEQCAGIYSFYDSSGRLIYIGKTEKNTLLAEMGQQFSKRKVRIRRTDGKGVFRHEWASLREFVEYCSAYSVHKSVVADFEALIARIAPNDIANDQIPRYKT